MTLEVQSLRTPSLGDATYVITRGSSAIVIDAQRDIARFVTALGDATVTHVLETHLHNDYLSGGQSLAADTGADLVLPAGAATEFAFVPAFHLEDLEAGSGMTIRPIHTPGHTPEHTSYLILVDGSPEAVFTGGSLLVGAAGRSDLLGLEFARQLSRLQFGSLERLAQLPDETGVYPTHGEGSFCTASGAGRTTSTIGQEKSDNRLYGFDDAEAFIADQLGGLAPYPSYYAHMGPANRSGAPPMPDRPVPEVTVDELAEHLAAGGVVVDARDRSAFAAGHVPGSIGVEYGDSFAPWAGWLLPHDAPIMLVLDLDQDPQWAATELARIGIEKVEGFMRGVAAWRSADHPERTYRNATFEELREVLSAGAAPQVVDVRDPNEWEAGHLTESVHRYVPDLLEGLPPTVDITEPIWLVCRTGNRASIAAGLVEKLGGQPIVVAKGGVPDLLDAGAT